MAVRRLDPEQPPSFAFTPENLAWAKTLITHYPEGKQAAAVIPLLWRAQEQNGGWTTEPMMRVVADMLGMAYIRVYEIATFYTMFQLSPVGRKAHVQVCGTTPCMLRGARDLVAVCKQRIAEHSHEPSADGNFSWEEVECLGSCANAPMVQIGKDTYEDLTPELLGTLLDAIAKGQPLQPGSQIGRRVSCPEGGQTTLTDATLYDGSTIGAWKKRFDDAKVATAAAAAAASTGSVAPAPTTPGNPAPTAEPVAAANRAPSAAPAQQAPTALASAPLHPAAAALIANSGLAPGLEARSTGGKPLSASELAALKASTVPGPVVGAATSEVAPLKPELLSAPRGGKSDDLKLIWGVAAKLEEKLNAMGIWHFDQIARWSPAHVAWFEDAMEGFKGRIARDKWIEQCQKLAAGWRPETDVGQRPKG